MKRMQWMFLVAIAALAGVLILFSLQLVGAPTMPTGTEAQLINTDPSAGPAGEMIPSEDPLATSTPYTTLTEVGESETPRRSSTSGETGTATQPLIDTTSDSDSVTPTSGATRGVEPTLSLEATPTILVPSGENLISNGDFSGGFAGWNQTNGYWRIHDITGSACDAENPDWPDFLAEADRDNCSNCNIWPPPPSEDWLWQDVHTPESHTHVILGLSEAHHMDQGAAEIRLFGSDDGVHWEQIWFRAAPQAEWGAGKFCETPPSFQHLIESSHGYYRLEMYAHLTTEEDGWLVGELSLSVK